MTNFNNKVLFILILTFCSVSSYAQDLNQYTVFEHRVNSGSFPQVANPYDPDQIKVDLWITSPGGTVNVPAFYEAVDFM